MDPALWELLRGDIGDGDREVEAIIRLDDPRVDVAGVRIVARFGRVATCRVQRDSIVRTWRDDNVVSLKRPRTIGPEPEWEPLAPTSDPPSQVLDHDARRSPGSPLTGAGVVVGVVDWGCDVDHPNFKKPDGTTRLLALWDQRSSSHLVASPQPYGYGRLFRSADIDRALFSGEPYRALQYHPANSDRDGHGAHGTHVMDIAAGNGHVGPTGVAPGADLVFVHLADCGTGGVSNLGDSARILEAIDFISRVAGHRPWVVNLSVGRHGGPHDGSTLAELALDEAVRAAPGRFIVQSAGNYFERNTHARGQLGPGGSHALTFVTNRADLTPNELEVWYPGTDELVVRLESPLGTRSEWVALGGCADILDDGDVVGRLYHRRRDPNNDDNHIDLFLSPWAPPGSWTATLRAIRVTSGTFHAWLERDEACGRCQTRFVVSDADRTSTIGTIANGREPFVVGAYDAHTGIIAPFSSAGPTRDGRAKPDCVAPGVQVLAARSTSRGGTRSAGLLTRKSGTSMAAPHVTGAVALILEGAPFAVGGPEIRALLDATLTRASPRPGRVHRSGGGALDIDRLTSALTGLRHSPAPQRQHPLKEPVMQTDPQISSRPDTLYRQIVGRHHEPLPDWIDESFLVVAAPGQSLSSAPQHGDVLVRVALGERGLGHVAVLSASDLVPWQSVTAAGITAEREGPGYYATVVEAGAFPHTRDDRFARRILDRDGRVPPGQLLLRPKTPAPIDDPDMDGTDGADADASQSAARLEWVDLQTTQGGDGRQHLYYLTTGPQGNRGPSRFHLKVTNTNNHLNFVKPFLKVRLRRRIDDAFNWKTIPLQGQKQGEDWKVIPSKELVDESAAVIKLEFDNRTLNTEHDPDQPMRWLDVQYHWQEFGGSRRSATTSLAFYLVAPVEFMLRSKRRIGDPQHLRDRTQYGPQHLLLASNALSTPLDFEVSGRAVVSNTETGQLTVQASVTETRGTQIQHSQTTSAEMSVGFGIEQMINVGHKLSASTTTGITWSESVARQLSTQASRTKSFTRGHEQTMALKGTIPAAPPGRAQVLYAYPIVNVFEVPLVLFGATNELGQAARRRPATTSIAWLAGWGYTIELE